MELKCVHCKFFKFYTFSKGACLKGLRAKKLIKKDAIACKTKFNLY